MRVKQMQSHWRGGGVLRVRLVSSDEHGLTKEVAMVLQKMLILSSQECRSEKEV